ncbi:MAG: RNA methyltransferase [Candidatus Hodarchaeales archaeon]|jgi:TrmH family RNA methyltransferase
MKEKESMLSIILVEPSKVQNIGSIARVMMNFGFSRLIMINPKVNLADPEIEIVARKAIKIIEQAQIFVSSLQELRNDFNLLIGTTARVGSDYNLNRVAITPEELFTDNLPLTKMGLVLGREQYGLTNDEINLCDLVLTIPSHSAYPVMNLSHALAILLYEFRQALKINEEEEIVEKPKHRAASFNEREQLKIYFNQLIEKVNYHPEKLKVANQAFSNILSRGYITGREVTTLMGVLKWIELQLK